MKYPKKTIPDRYWNELNNSGSTVPRNEKTGDVLPFVVGKQYIIVNEETKKELKQLLSDYAVLVFPNQFLGPAELIQTGEIFGTLMPQQLQKFCSTTLSADVSF